MLLYAIQPRDADFQKVGMWSGDAKDLTSRYSTPYGEFDYIYITCGSDQNDLRCKEAALHQHLTNAGLWLRGELFLPCFFDVEAYAKQHKYSYVAGSFVRRRTRIRTSEEERTRIIQELLDHLHIDMANKEEIDLLPKGATMPIPFDQTIKIFCFQKKKNPLHRPYQLVADVLNKYFEANVCQPTRDENGKRKEYTKKKVPQYQLSGPDWVLIKTKWKPQHLDGSYKKPFGNIY